MQAAQEAAMHLPASLAGCTVKSRLAIAVEPCCTTGGGSKRAAGQPCKSPACCARRLTSPGCGALPLVWEMNGVVVARLHLQVRAPPHHLGSPSPEVRPMGRLARLQRGVQLQPSIAAGCGMLLTALNYAVGPQLGEQCTAGCTSQCGLLHPDAKALQQVASQHACQVLCRSLLDHAQKRHI